ncbi:MAG: hypothetical protein Q4E37_05675 [Tissierellia bacterium]|nr:hypothetical protein [Tissierellia bacterium]
MKGWKKLFLGVLGLGLLAAFPPNQVQAQAELALEGPLVIEAGREEEGHYGLFEIDDQGQAKKALSGVQWTLEDPEKTGVTLQVNPSGSQAQIQVPSKTPGGQVLLRVQVSQLAYRYQRTLRIQILKEGQSLPGPDPVQIDPKYSTGGRALVSNQVLLIDGRPRPVGAYNINGENYFRLRDLAVLLRGSPAKFGLVYEKEADRVLITRGQTYDPMGGDLAPLAPGPQTYQASRQRIDLKEAPVGLRSPLGLRVYNIQGNNYFRLRDLGQVLNFRVAYDPLAREILVRTS